jgi:nitric oxide reductase NorQ protein
MRATADEAGAGPGGADPLAAWRLRAEPFYQPLGREVQAFEAAAACRLPVLLKGPTGCGKTRFVEHMAWRLGRPWSPWPATKTWAPPTWPGAGCSTPAAPTGRTARWPWPRAMALCYLDELVEARADATVLLHPGRQPPRAAAGAPRRTAAGPPRLPAGVSYNPGYQGLHKALKPSMRQRFTALQFDYPEPAQEADVVAREAGSMPRWHSSWWRWAGARARCRTMGWRRAPPPACWCMPRPWCAPAWRRPPPPCRPWPRR